MGVTIIPAGMENDPHYWVPEWPGASAQELQPNFFCRGRNFKREKYCRARSGQGTEHLGQGRCKNHGGSTPIVHGRYSEVVRDTLGEHLDRLALETEKEQLDIMPEAALLRGITMTVAEKWQELTAALMAWNEAEMAEAAAEERRPKLQQMPELSDLADLAKKTAEIVNMVHKQRSANAIGLADFYRLMGAMAEIVVHEIDTLERFVSPDKLDAVKKRIDEQWRKIKQKGK